MKSDSHSAYFRWLMVPGLTAALLLGGCGKPEPAPPSGPARPVQAPVPVVEPPPKSQWKATASAVQEDIYPAAYVCDDRGDTRWSSPGSDPEWVQVDFGITATVCGVTIVWEHAFSSEYSVLTSLDGEQWKEAYSTTQGDGGTDDLHFPPVAARFIRVLGTKRGSGWGHSIWELDVKGPSEQVVVQAASRPGSEAGRAMDGRLDTSWVSAGPCPVSMTIDFRKEKSFGGLRIDWGSGYATELDVYGSPDGSAWTRIGELREGTGIFDIILHPRSTARHLRLDFIAAAGPGPVEIREVSLKGPDEIMTPLALYQVAAAKAPPGLYPDSLRKRQAYWTIVGLPGDRQESLLDEYGNLEPVAGAPILMPYLFMNGSLLSAMDAPGLSQALEDGFLPMPSVAWTFDTVRLDIHALAWGSPGHSATFVRYRLVNTSPEPQAGRLFLAVRPVQVNPPWQYGGLSPIRSLAFETLPHQAAVNINGKPVFLALAPPDAAGARTFDRGDVARELAQGKVPADPGVSEGDEFISGAMAYDFSLAPGETRIVVVAAPLHGKLEPVEAFLRRGYGETAAPEEAFEAHWNEMRLYWLEQLGEDVIIELPDQAIADTMKSQIAYILVNRDGTAIQPGSRNYKRSWIRDGCLTSAAMLRMGLVEPVREFLDWYGERVADDGWVPPILENTGEINKGFGWDNEYDSQGQYIYAIMEYYRFTRDRDVLARHYPRVRRSMEYLVKLREQTLSPDHMKGQPARDRFVGILPASISHEGYSPAMHSYWDDFFALKGWKDGREAALIMGDTNTAAWAEEQYRLLRSSVGLSIERTIAFKNIDFIPGCAEKGDLDATSTTIAFFPCDEQDILPPDALRGTYDRYFADVEKRKNPSWSGSFTPYEIRNLSAFVGIGRKDRAEFLLDYLMSCRRPAAWNHWGEVVLGDVRMGSYIGDMPHTWVGSGYVNAIRGMLARELDGKLLLLRGAPESWVREGQGIRIEKLPTHFGRLDMTAKADGQQLAVKLAGEIDAPNGIEIIWPIAGKPASVAVDGADWTDYDELACRLPGGAKEVIATW